jgi:hypothetical protein
MFEALALGTKEVYDNIKVFIAMGPVASLKNMSSPLFNELKKFPWLPEALILLKEYEFLPRTNFTSKKLGALCRYLPNICGDTLKYVMDANPKVDDWDR